MMCQPRVRLTSLLLAAALVWPALARADDVLPGFDLFQTTSSPTQPTYQDFSGPFAIPPGFFDPGSDPFTGVVQLQGVPLGSYPGCAASDLGLADTIVERLAAAALPGIGASDTIPIELVALSLVSVMPVTITYSGASPELWDLGVDPSPSLPSTGSMTIYHTLADGGVFDSVLTVYPRLTFRRQSDGAIRILDAGAFGLADIFKASGVPWSHTCDGTVMHPACSKNFCASFGPGGKTYTAEQAMLAAHGVTPACPSPLTIFPGADLFETDPQTTYQDFASPYIIPGSFFDGDCSDFQGRVPLRGEVLPEDFSCPFPSLGTTDTIVNRLEPASLPGVPSSATIPVELVALSLVSSSPITVNCLSGPQSWNLSVAPSCCLPSQGRMTIHRTGPAGGTFDSFFDVFAGLTFTRLSDGKTFAVDAGVIGLPPITLNATGSPWEESCPPDVAFQASCSSNYCASFSSAAGGKVLTIEQGALAAHGVVPASPLRCPQSCDDKNPCTRDFCDILGVCFNLQEPEGTSCSDGNACNGAEMCVQGSCQLAQPLDCSDGNPCTEDRCDPATGCFHPAAPDGQPCDDRNLCTGPDVCVRAVCQGAPVVCDDHNACTADACDPSSGCQFVPTPGARCDDGIPCTQNDVCSLADPPVCRGTPVPPGEVNPLLFRDQATLQWPPAPLDALLWNTYKGSIPSTGMKSRPSIYDHTCFESGDAAANGPTTSIDRGLPPARSAFYYLVTPENQCGEGLPGFAFIGGVLIPIPIPDSSRCPTPP